MGRKRSPLELRYQLGDQDAAHDSGDDYHPHKYVIRPGKWRHF